MKNLPPLTAYQFPKFDSIVDPKTFELLVPHEVAEAPRPQGLFEALLKDHVEILASDAIEEPEKYNPQVISILREMLDGKKSSKSLTASERRLLDQATLDFATYTAPKPVVQPPRKELPARVKQEESSEEGTPVPGIDVPITEAPAYWWLK